MTKKSEKSSEPENLSLERAIYEDVRSDLASQFKKRFGECHLEITARGEFSEDIKQKVPQDREIIFSILQRRKAFPDITGFVKRTFGFFDNTEFVTVEIKRTIVELDDLYQAWKYADLFGARFGLLISDQRFPEEMKRLDRVAHVVERKSGSKIYCGYYDNQSKSVQTNAWYPSSPFGAWE